MKRTTDKTAYEPPHLEAVEVSIERGLNVSLSFDAEDWTEGGGGDLYTE